MASVTSRAPSFGIALRGLRALDRIATGIADHRRRGAVLRELNNCDDRDLRDLGISRYDFKAIADGSFRR